MPAWKSTYYRLTRSRLSELIGTSSYTALIMARNCAMERMSASRRWRRTKYSRLSWAQQVSTTLKGEPITVKSWCINKKKKWVNVAPVIKISRLQTVWHRQHQTYRGIKVEVLRVLRRIILKHSPIMIPRRASPPIGTTLQMQEVRAPEALSKVSIYLLRSRKTILRR